MKAKYRRFEGENAQRIMVGDVNPAWAWRVECKTCHQTGQVFCHGNNPETTWRRFGKMGWVLSNNPGDDECGECVDKRREAHRAEKEARRQAHTKSVQTAVAQAHRAIIEQMSPDSLVAAMRNGSGVIPDEPDAKARIALAVLIQEILTHDPWDLHEVRDLLPLVMRYWALTNNVEQKREIRSQIKMAAFSRNRRETAAARTEIHRLLAQADEARDAELRAKLDAEVPPPPEPKSPVQKFTEKFAPIVQPKPVVQPKPEVWFTDTAPKPAPKPTPATMPDEPVEEPAWLRNARKRFAGEKL